MHERSVEIDLLLFLVRSLLVQREGKLRVVLMSATLDPTLFANYFGGAPVCSLVVGAKSKFSTKLSHLVGGFESFV